MKIFTQSRLKPMREFLAHPAFHAAIGMLAAMALIDYLMQVPASIPSTVVSTTIPMWSPTRPT